LLLNVARGSPFPSMACHTVLTGADPASHAKFTTMESTKIHTLYTEGRFACIEFVEFKGSDQILVQEYGTRFDKATLRSWLSPKNKGQYLPKTEARKIYADFKSNGYA